MNTFMKMVKEGKIGTLCKRAAWLIAVLGTVQILMQLYASWGLYNEIQQQQQLPAPYSYLLFNLSSVFSDAIGTIFYFFILYTAGVIINSFFAPVNNDITYETIDDEAVPIDE